MTETLNSHHPPLKGAIVGFGNVAHYAHLPAWLNNRDFLIDAVLEPDPERAEIARKMLPEAHIHSSLQALLAENSLSFLDICCPPCFHADLVVSACQSGLHVFCEKPLTTSLSDLERIRLAAEGSGKVVFTVNNWKYAPIWVEACQLIRAGAIGKVHSIELNVLRPPNSGGGHTNWRKSKQIAGGGILIDHGWHNLYLIMAMIDAPPVSITASMQSGSDCGAELEETVDVELQFAEASARLYLTWQADCRKNYGTISGDRGTLYVNDDHLVVKTQGALSRRQDFLQALSAGSHHIEWMEPVVADFAREIKGQNGQNRNLAEAQRCAELIHLAYLSHQEGARTIPVASLLPQAATP